MVIFDAMLTDMTPTAGQLYGSQIPAMTMSISNINKTVSLFRFFDTNLVFY